MQGSLTMLLGLASMFIGCAPNLEDFAIVDGHFEDHHLVVTVENRGDAEAWVVSSPTRVLEPEPGTSDVLLGFDDAFVSREPLLTFAEVFPTQERIGSGVHEIRTDLADVHCLLVDMEALDDPNAPGEVVTDRPDLPGSLCAASAPVGQRLFLHMIPLAESTLHLTMSVFEHRREDDPELSKSSDDVIANDVQLGHLESVFDFNSTQ